jgi:hypothetical protein
MLARATLDGTNNRGIDMGATRDVVAYNLIRGGQCTGQDRLQPEVPALTYLLAIYEK